MKKPAIASRLLALVTLAAIGLTLIYVPSELLEKYEIAVRLGPVWGRVYLVTVGVGLAAIIGSAGWLLWRLTIASRRKRRTLRRR